MARAKIFYQIVGLTLYDRLNAETLIIPVGLSSVCLQTKPIKATILIPTGVIVSKSLEFFQIVKLPKLSDSQERLLISWVTMISCKHHSPDSYQEKIGQIARN